MPARVLALITALVVSLAPAVAFAASPSQVFAGLGAAGAIFPGSVSRSDSTSSRSYVTLVGPGFDIDTAGRSTIVIQFVSYGALNEANRTLFVRATVDGAAVNPGSMRFTATRNSSIVYTGWLPGVAAGHHSIRMQWAVSGGTATVGNRTTVVTVIPE